MRPRPDALLFAIVCAGFLLGGCSLENRTLIPPDSPEGQACLSSECDLIRSQCEGRQEGRERECLDRHAEAQSRFDMCQQSNGNDCAPPDPCTPADMTICRIQYDECYVQCGGRLERDFSLTPKQQPEPADSAASASSAGDPP